MKHLTKEYKIALLLLGLGLLFVCVGLLQGGYQDAFRKAIRVCLECIGIG